MVQPDAINQIFIYFFFETGDECKKKKKLKYKVQKIQ